METAGWYDAVKNNFRPPFHHMLQLPDIYIWKYNRITGEGISDDSLSYLNHTYLRIAYQ